MRKTFINSIDKFLRESGMSASKFSEQVMNDRSWLSRLRDGTDPTLSTVERVNSFMDKFTKAQKRKATREKTEAA